VVGPSVHRLGDGSLLLFPFLTSRMFQTPVTVTPPPHFVSDRGKTGVPFLTSWIQGSPVFSSILLSGHPPAREPIQLLLDLPFTLLALLFFSLAGTRVPTRLNVQSLVTGFLYAFSQTSPILLPMPYYRFFSNLFFETLTPFCQNIIPEVLSPPPLPPQGDLSSHSTVPNVGPSLEPLSFTPPFRRPGTPFTLPLNSPLLYSLAYRGFHHPHPFQRSPYFALFFPAGQPHYGGNSRRFGSPGLEILYFFIPIGCISFLFNPLLYF